MDYFGARYFSAAQGRFTTPDWSTTPQAVPYADLTDPQTLNLYSYVRNNPLSKADPDGHCLWDLCIGEGAAAYAVGAAAVGTAAYLMTPQGQKSVQATVEGIGLLVHKGVDAISSLLPGRSADPQQSTGTPGTPAGTNLDTATPGTPATAPSGVQSPIQSNTNPYAGPVSSPVTVVDSKGNAIPVKTGEQLQGSKDGRYVQVKDANGNPTGARIDAGHKPTTHPDPRAQQPHAHVPGKTNPDGTPWLPINH